MLASPAVSACGGGLEEGTLDLSVMATANATGIVIAFAAFDAADANAMVVVATAAECLRALVTRATSRAGSAGVTAADTTGVLANVTAFPEEPVCSCNSLPLATFASSCAGAAVVGSI